MLSFKRDLYLTRKEKNEKMHYDGTFGVSESKEVCYTFETDPAKITTLFPDVELVKIVDSENFELKRKIGISFIKGMMQIKGTIAETKALR